MPGSPYTSYLLLGEIEFAQIALQFSTLVKQNATLQ